jgi:hypothetical protein
MSAEISRAAARALSRLASPDAVLAPERTGSGYGVFTHGDRRRRPLARLSAQEVKALVSSGALTALEENGAFVLTEAGKARARREAAAPVEQYIAQHRPIEARMVMDADADMRAARGHDAQGPLKRLTALRGPDGRPWLAAEEQAAAQRLRASWEAGQRGLVRGADWSAAPRSGAARGPGNAAEAAMAAGCDARARVARMLDALAPPLRRVVERVCLQEEGLEALERSEGWPARSGKIALKLGLAQIAAQRL